MERHEDDMGTEPRGAVEEMRRAVGGFVQDFKGFQDEMKTKLQQTEERMTMLDRKMTLPARTPLAGAVETGAPHQKALHAYIRHGDDDGYPPVKDMLALYQRSLICIPIPRGLSSSAEKTARATPSSLRTVVWTRRAAFSACMRTGQGCKSLSSVFGVATTRVNCINVGRDLMDDGVRYKRKMAWTDDECFESSLMTHVLPVRCVASKMKWAVGSARSDDATAAAAARIIAVA